MKLISILLLITSYSYSSFTLESHKFCQKDSKYHKKYCLEVLEVPYINKTVPKDIVLLIPGLLQNANIYDLVPEKGISLSRYISQKFNLKVYILNIRTVGDTTYIPNTSVDDIAIDDIPNAINFINKLTGKKPIVIGHSQGAISLNASISGLTRCAKFNCFDSKVALNRQGSVKNIGLLAGDNRLAMKESNPVLHLSRFIQTIRPMLWAFDEIDLKLLSSFISPLGYLNFWDIVVNEDNVSDFSKKMLLERSVESTSVAILDQFTSGVVRGDLRSSSGESYADNSKNILLPVYQQVFGKDWLSPFQSVLEDSFLLIGSSDKVIEYLPHQGHEDFMVNSGFHTNIDPMIEFLIR